MLKFEDFLKTALKEEMGFHRGSKRLRKKKATRALRRQWDTIYLFNLLKW